MYLLPLPPKSRHARVWAWLIKLAAVPLCAATTTASAVAIHPGMSAAEFADAVNANAAVSAAATQKLPPEKQTLTIVVLRDENVASDTVPADARTLVALANANSANGRRLKASLGAPSLVRELIVERPSAEHIAALKPNTPEHRLLNYVVLQYPDVAATVLANEALISQRLYRSVQIDMFADFSAVPNDPYFDPAQSSR